MNWKCVILSALLTLSAFAEEKISGTPVAQLPIKPGKIFMGEENFPGHLQGIAADETGIYWSIFDTILKTDWTGKSVKKIRAPKHSGDCCIGDKGYLYVSIAYYDPEMIKKDGTKGAIYVYDKNLNFVTKHLLAKDMMPDGITYLDGKYYVCNDKYGFPAHPHNEIMIYDKDFKLLKTVTVDFGIKTHYGCQTINAYNNELIASFYVEEDKDGKPLDPLGAPIFTKDLVYTGRRFPRRASVGQANVPESIAGMKGVFLAAYDTGTRPKFSAAIDVYRIENGKMIPVDITKKALELQKKK